MESARRRADSIETPSPRSPPGVQSLSQSAACRIVHEALTGDIVQLKVAFHAKLPRRLGLRVPRGTDCPVRFTTVALQLRCFVDSARFS